MNRSIANTTGFTQINSQNAQVVNASQQTPNLKNLAAFHEMMIREQFVMPDFHSKFISRETMLQMYHGTIFSIKTN